MSRIQNFYLQFNHGGRQKCQNVSGFIEIIKVLGNITEVCASPIQNMPLKKTIKNLYYCMFVNQNNLNLRTMAFFSRLNSHNIKVH